MNSAMPLLNWGTDGYNSAEAVATAVRKRLRESGFSQLDAIECTVEEEEVVLTGEVATFYLKQMAQALASQVDGIGRVTNRLRVSQRNRR